MTRVLVLNGPNLGRLGRRQPEVYGTTTYAELVDLCVQWGHDLAQAARVSAGMMDGYLAVPAFPFPAAATP